MIGGHGELQRIWNDSSLGARLRTDERSLSVLIILALLGAVEVFGHWTDDSTFIPLSAMSSSAVEILLSGVLIEHVRITGLAVVVSFVLSMVAGSALGFLMWWSQYAHDVLEPYIAAYYSIPVFVFYPMFVSIFGFGVWPIVYVTMMWACIIIAMNVREGLHTISEIHVKVGRSFNLSQYEMVRKIYVPNMLPYLFSGAKIGLLFIILGTIGAEFIMSTTGIGHMVQQYYAGFQTDKMYGLILLISVSVMVIMQGIYTLENRIPGVSEI